MAMAIAYVWITEDLYDKEYVAARTTGFDEWREYSRRPVSLTGR